MGTGVGVTAGQQGVAGSEISPDVAESRYTETLQSSVRGETAPSDARDTTSQQGDRISF